MPVSPVPPPEGCAGCAERDAVIEAQAAAIRDLRARLERLMELPYYMTPLVGALAWGVIAAPKTGLANQLARLLGTNGDVLNIYSPWGIAWVSA